LKTENGTSNFEQQFKIYIGNENLTYENIWKLLKDFCEGLKVLVDSKSTLNCLLPENFVVKKLPTGEIYGQLLIDIGLNSRQDLEFYGNILNEKMENKPELNKILIKFMFCLMNAMKNEQIQDIPDIKILKESLKSLEPFRVYLFHDLMKLTFKTSKFKLRAVNPNEENFMTFEEFYKHPFWWNLSRIKDFIHMSNHFMFNLKPEKRIKFKKFYGINFMDKNAQSWWYVLPDIYKNCSYVEITRGNGSQQEIPVNQQTAPHALKYIHNFVSSINFLNELFS
jgi:hypothetical protein